MPKFYRPFAAALLLAGSTLVHAQGPNSPASAPGAVLSHGSEQLHQSMMNGMQKMQGMQPTGDTDKDFAMMMRAHHQQAVDMAKAEMQHGKSPELKAMAGKMVSAQEKEIRELDQWLAKHK